VLLTHAVAVRDWHRWFCGFFSVFNRSLSTAGELVWRNGVLLRRN
jgi:hypothetical protein